MSPARWAFAFCVACVSGTAWAQSSGTKDHAKAGLLRFDRDIVATCTEVEVTVDWGAGGRPEAAGIASIRDLALTLADDAGLKPKSDTILKRARPGEFAVVATLMLDPRADLYELARIMASEATDERKRETPNETDPQPKTVDDVRAHFEQGLRKLESRAVGSCAVVGRPPLGRCVMRETLPPRPSIVVAFNATTFVYSLREAVDTDSALRECVASRGTWTPPNLDDDVVRRAIDRARLDALQEQVERATGGAP